MLICSQKRMPCRLLCTIWIALSTSLICLLESISCFDVCVFKVLISMFKTIQISNSMLQPRKLWYCILQLFHLIYVIFINKLQALEISNWTYIFHIYATHISIVMQRNVFYNGDHLNHGSANHIFRS